MKNKRTKSANGGNGSKWIRPEKRRRIYYRDEWRCAYCGRPVYSVADAISERMVPPKKAEPATLDHIVCRKQGGQDNRETNLVTCCLSCNSKRQDKSIAAFARQMEKEDRRRSAKAIVNRVNKLRRRVLPELPEEL